MDADDILRETRNAAHEAITGQQVIEDTAVDPDDFRTETLQRLLATLIAEIRALRADLAK